MNKILQFVKGLLVLKQFVIISINNMKKIRRMGLNNQYFFGASQKKSSMKYTFPYWRFERIWVKRTGI